MNIGGVGRNDEALVGPMHEVARGIDTDAPGPDVAAPMGVLLVLAVPIVGGVLLVVEHLEAVGFDLLAFGIEPRTGRADGCWLLAIGCRRGTMAAR